MDSTLVWQEEACALKADGGPDTRLEMPRPYDLRTSGW